MRQDYEWFRVLVILGAIFACGMTCINAFGAMPEKHGAVKDEVLLVEVNHFYNDQDGKLVFDQVIWYDWNSKESRYDVVDWRLLKNVRGEIDKDEAHKHWLDPKNVPPPDPKWLGGHATPIKNWGKWVSTWHDEKCRGVLREVTAAIRCETWTMYDPELVAREDLPQERRRKLRKP
jgi:hypothetical protein